MRRGFLAGLIPLAFCLAMGADNSYANDTVKIAGVFSLTGRAAYIGTSQRDAVLVALDEANAQGGYKGRKFEIIMEDDESEPTKAVMALKKILQKEKVVAIIGPTVTGTAMAMRSFVEKEQIPTFMHAGSDVILTVPLEKNDPKSLPKWTFKSPYKSADVMAKLMEYMQKHGMKRIGFMYSNEGLGHDGVDHVKIQAPKYGIEVVSYEAFEPKDVDMTSQLTRMNGQGVSAIIFWTIGPPMGIIPKNAKQLGIKTPLFALHGAADQIFWQMAGEAGEGVLMPSTKIIVADQLPDSDIQKKKLLTYNKAFRDRFKQEPGTMVAYGADAAYITLDAIKRAGLDRAKIRDAIESTKGYVGLSGVYNISPEDHNGLSVKDIVMTMATQGRWKLIE